MALQGEETQPLKTKTSEQTYEYIKKNRQVWKFCAYGFLKNMKFFDPFYWVILQGPPVNFSLFDIGTLISIQTGIQWCFEVPTGMMADRFGRKIVLESCFIFYTISFVFYYMGCEYITACLYIAACFYGVGEATRSGIHKAMIIQWLDAEKLKKYKTFTYGRTRSFSQVGSAVSSAIGILLMVFLPKRYRSTIFLFSSIPYVLDFFLIWSYPSYMNEMNYKKGQNSIYSAFALQFKNLALHIAEKDLRKCLFSGSLFSALYWTLRSYIQPIMRSITVIMLQQLGYSLPKHSQTEILMIILGTLYCIFSLGASFASKNTYILTDVYKIEAKFGIDILYYLWAFDFLLIAICLFLDFPWPIPFLYMFIFVSQSCQKPFIVTCYGDLMDKKHKAAVLSVEMFLKTLFMFIMAPLFGWLADYNLYDLFFALPPILIFLEMIFLSGKITKKSEQKSEQCG